MCGEEKEEAEKSPLYDYKRAYFKIVQALIDDHRTAFKIFVEFVEFLVQKRSKKVENAEIIFLENFSNIKF